MVSSLQMDFTIANLIVSGNTYIYIYILQQIVIDI